MIRTAHVFAVAATVLMLAACGPAPNGNSAAPQAAPAATPAAQPKPVRHREPRHEASRPAPPPVCNNCGTVTSIRAVKKEGEPGLLGTLAGAAAGGLLGSQFGKGTGKAAMTAAGAVGGAFAGRAVQERVSSSTVYEVSVRMDAGGTRTFTLPSPGALAVGSKVHVNGDTLTLG